MIKYYNYKLKKTLMISKSKIIRDLKDRIKNQSSQINKPYSEVNKCELGRLFELEDLVKCYEY